MLMSATKAMPTATPVKMLVGKSAIVTGSTSGIGLGIARALAASGANVLLNGFGDRREIETICADITAESGVAAHYDAADMSKPEAVEGMAGHAAALFRSVDIIVNNAGIQHVGPLETFPVAKWDAILAINLSAAFHLTRAVFAGMKARKWGRIVNVSSAHGLVASPVNA